MDINSPDSKRLLRDAKKLILSSSCDDIVKGLKCLKKIIKNDPENLWAFIYYGVGASKSDKYSHEAVRAFETASQISPDSVECWRGIRACLENKEKSPGEIRLLVKAYCNLLRLECDPDKWSTLFSDIKASSSNISLGHTATVLASLVDDFSSKSFKHELACKELSLMVLNNQNLFETNMEDALNAFFGWANFLDFADRPEFCKRVCAVLSKLKLMGPLSNFLHHTLMVYGPKLYLKYQLLQYFIDIAFDRMDNADKLIPLIKKPLQELESVQHFKSGSQVKLALCIINFFEEDFTVTRESLENLCSVGDIHTTLFLLKLLCKAKDYESVLLLCVRFAKIFNSTSNDKFKHEFILCLVEALSCCNEVSFLNWSVRLGLKTWSKYEEDHNLFYHLCHSYAGKRDLKALAFLDKLAVWQHEEVDFLRSLINCRMCSSSEATDQWALVLLSANFDLIDNNMKRSLKGFTKVAVKDKLLSEPFIILGVDSLVKQNIARAVSCFHRAFSLCPLNEDILKLYLDSLFRMEDEQRALNTLDSVWNSNLGKWHLIGEKALFSSGLIHSAKYEHEKSIRSFKQLIKLNPDCSELIEAISDEYIRLGRLGTAENYICRLVSDDPYNLHPLLSLTEVYKFDVNYSCYFNHAIKCLNFAADETKESEQATKLILCFFINFFRKNTKIEASSLTYLCKQCENAFYKIERIVAKGLLEKNSNNEFINAVYMFVESHFIAAVKLMAVEGKFEEVKELFNFCIKVIGRVIEIYGSIFVSFWKLLGDILLKSSQLKCNLFVFSWLVNDENYRDSGKMVAVTTTERIHLSLKCFIVGLEIVLSRSLARSHEFFYDISVALIYLANHSEIENPEYRYCCLKSALESCMKSFVHSDGTSETRWIHSNLLGVIVSLLGIRDNMFQEHFSCREIKMNEGTVLQNYATHLAKTGLFTQAEETYEQARLRVDMDYSSSWTGQLLMQLIGNDAETKKMLQYNLTQIGKHPLYKWILGFFLTENRIGLELHGGQYSILKYAFSQSECMRETNSSRLTVAGYIHESVGDLATSRKFYMRALRSGQYVSDDTYKIFLGNAIRVNERCNQNLKLIELSDSSFSSLATPLFYDLCTHHVSFLDINKSVLFKTATIMQHLFNLTVNDKNFLWTVLPLLCKLSDIDFSHYINEKGFFIFDFLIENIIILLKRQRKELRLLISALDHSGRSFLLKRLEMFLSSLKYEFIDINTKLLSVDSCISSIVEKTFGKITISVPNQGSDMYSIALGLSPFETKMTQQSESQTDSFRGIQLTSLHETVENGSIRRRSINSCPYSEVLDNLRKSIYPLPLSDEERLMIKRNRILNLQKAKIEEREKKSLPSSKGSYINVKEVHGCHSGCNIMLSLLRKSISIRDFNTSLKYAHLCLDIRCVSCLRNSKILPLISYISVEANNSRLIQKAVHLYPDDCLLRKTTLLFLTGSRV